MKFEMECEGADIFYLSYFDFMPIGTNMMGNKIRDAPTNEPLRENWNQFPFVPQGPLGIPPLLAQDMA